jgi:prolyl-tRNA editing enzyme YbaK/EbsC (Cys-tRNA(Pro) deacylase)/predicted Fe-S protein YdhL (DUF1289 family)
MSSSVRRVAEFLRQRGHAHAPQMLSDAARTAQQAADALGVALGQIAKSIIFRRLSDDTAVLVVTSGDRRVDVRKVEALVGPLGRADAAFVKARTGFSLGGVAPVAHAQPGLTLVDRELLRLTPAQLCDMVGTPACDVVEPPGSALPAGPAQPALQRLLERAQAVTEPVTEAGPCPSPCLSVCRMDEASGQCRGCLRTLQEIAGWSQMDDGARRAVWQQIATRARWHETDHFLPGLHFTLCLPGL